MEDEGLSDVVALFHCSFHVTKGNLIDWTAKQDHIDLDGLEYACLPSGLHLVEKDIIYMHRNGYEGVCVFRRRGTSEDGLRGARFSAVGLLVEKSSRPRPWRHLKGLHTLSELDDSPEGREGLTSYYEAHKQSGTKSQKPWIDWPTELSHYPDHPLRHLPLLLRILGPSIMTLIKYVLTRKRIMIYTHPAAELSCLMAVIASEVCHQDRGAASERPITVLGMVGLADLDRLALETSRGYGWIACTTDKIFLDKTMTYDLIIDFTTPTQDRTLTLRPTFYAAQSHFVGTRRETRLDLIRFTFSDLRTWFDLDGILSSADEAGPNTTLTPDMYEQWCVALASLFIGGPKRQATNGSGSPRPRVHRLASQSSSQIPLLTDFAERPTNQSPHVGLVLRLLTVLHQRVETWTAQANDIVIERGDRTHLRSSNSSISISPRIISSFGLSPLSQLDTDFCIDLIRARAVLEDSALAVYIHRSWRDFADIVLCAW